MIDRLSIFRAPTMSDVEPGGFYMAHTLLPLNLCRWAQLNDEISSYSCIKNKRKESNFTIRVILYNTWIRIRQKLLSRTDCFWKLIRTFDKEGELHFFQNSIHNHRSGLKTCCHFELSVVVLMLFYLLLSISQSIIFYTIKQLIFLALHNENQKYLEQVVSIFSDVDVDRANFVRKTYSRLQLPSPKSPAKMFVHIYFFWWLCGKLMKAGGNCVNCKVVIFCQVLQICNRIWLCIMDGKIRTSEFRPSGFWCSRASIRLDFGIVRIFHSPDFDLSVFFHAALCGLD